MKNLPAARALLDLIETNRRSGSTTALLQMPAVVSGVALYVTFNQDALNQAKRLCPTLRGTTLTRLISGRGERVRGPLVVDPAAIEMALREVFAALKSEAPKTVDSTPPAARWDVPVRVIRLVDPEEV